MGECSEAIYSNNILLCIYTEGVCSKRTHNGLMVMNRKLVWQIVFNISFPKKFFFGIDHFLCAQERTFGSLVLKKEHLEASTWFRTDQPKFKAK
jgi:hypothetical protein